MHRFDVIVVGGGPSGAVCAIKCAKMGFRTMLLEKSTSYRKKVCGGITPTITKDLLELELGLSIPKSVLSVPERLGLFYVPPSGKHNGGTMRNYSLINLCRVAFDEWLREEASMHNVHLLYRAEFNALKLGKHSVLKVRVNGNLEFFEATYVVGADGAFSKVRSCLFPNYKLRMLTVIQEVWDAEGDFQDNFYVILNGKIVPTYGYVIPKDENFLIGFGFESGAADPKFYRDGLLGLLKDEFSFKPIKMNVREVAPIPFALSPLGLGNVVLVGDAGGLCNPFSGEGIRFAIESGAIAAESIKISHEEDANLITIYESRMEWLKEFLLKMHTFVSELDDEKREAFVKEELSRLNVF
ncbi:MAG: NAD(P)/FAD-dependent oxidoreductase [Nitrososphaerota archaeon]|nr:NAD(P)/FAD-dependent oxidoreductase [Aigarchaeota archaeon]MDW8076488.1 NAD(P)/FAD-dependent oxidoreductase [Nitrososphaerota archaeon]